MGDGWRALRRRILTPNTSATLLDTRGFHTKNRAAQEKLETIGAVFLRGYGYAVGARSVADAHERLATVPDPFRGFAYEGAAMGFAMLDGLPFGGRRHIARFLDGPGDDHIYMVYVGVGWAMARLPRFRWPRPDEFDPLLRWLVLDGYGFHQAYFRTRRYVHEHYQDPAFPWPGNGQQEYAGRVIDQGIGRALWFVGGADPQRVVELIERFPASRHSDLYGGAGLAAGYAGGVDEQELTALRESAGEHRGPLGQGAAFAAEARIRAGLLVPETEAAARVLCGLSADRAARITQDVRPDRPDRADRPGTPAYESWRQRIADQFAAVRRP